MTYFDDGSAYSCLPRSPEDRSIAAINVGWLDADHRFATRVASRELVEKIAWLCVNRRTCQTRGIHLCNLCSPAEHPYHYIQLTGLLGLRGRKILLGSAEIRVEGTAATYAAPNLILHYLQDHSYCPPAGFIEAVLALKERLSSRSWSLRRGVYW